MKSYLSKFWSDESGATAIEYGLIAAGDFPGDHRRGQRPGHQLEHPFYGHQQFAEVTNPVS
jgi:hypothetical protein